VSAALAATGFLLTLGLGPSRRAASVEEQP